jgi:DNA-binding FadR family transcriptional regulator
MRRPRYLDVMLDLLDAVAGGRYPPGTRLPNVPELADSLGASRGVLREALLVLRLRGVIAGDSGPSSVVNEYEHWDLRAPEVLVASSAYGLQPDLLGHAVDARAAIERVAAAHACLHATDGDLGLLSGYADAIELAAVGLLEPGPELDAFAHAEAWFHTALGRLSENPVLAMLGEPLHALLADLRRRRAPDRDQAAIRAHRQILAGISSREPALAEEAVDAYARALRRWLAGRG